jgi:hypothetical protein
MTIKTTKKIDGQRNICVYLRIGALFFLALSQGIAVSASDTFPRLLADRPFNLSTAYPIILFKDNAIDKPILPQCGQLTLRVEAEKNDVRFTIIVSEAIRGVYRYSVLLKRGSQKLTVKWKDFEHLDVRNLFGSKGDGILRPQDIVAIELQLSDPGAAKIVEIKEEESKEHFLKRLRREIEDCLEKTISLRRKGFALNIERKLTEARLKCESIPGQAEELLKEAKEWIKLADEAVLIQDRIEDSKKGTDVLKDKSIPHESAKRLVIKMVNLFQGVQSILGRKKAFKEAKDQLERVKDTILFFNQEMDRLWGSPIETSLSSTSFGRFGWHKGDGLLINNIERGNINRWAGDGAEFGGYYKVDNRNWCISFSPSGAKWTREEVKDVTWTTAKWKNYYESPEGEKFYQEITYGLCAPGILINTDYHTLSLTSSGTYFNKAIVPTAEGIQVISRVKKAIKEKLSENWMLLVSEDGLPEIPIVLVFEKRPDELRWTERKFEIRKDKGLSIVGLATPFGVKTLPANISQSWKSPPQYIITQCRNVARMLNCYPYKCREFYSILKDRVWIRDEYEYLKLNDDWNTNKEEYAPVSPLISLAISTGYPAKTISEMEELSISTKYGPYWAAPGKAVEYTLPLPILNHRCYLKTGKYPDFERVIDWKADLFVTHSLAEGEGIFNFRKHEYHDAVQYAYRHHNTWDHWWGSRLVYPECSLFQSWNYLSPETREKFLQSLKVTIPRVFLQQVWHKAIEPYTNKEYYFGFRYGTYADSSPRSHNLKYNNDVNAENGMVLYGLYNYAKYTGDWKLIQDNWKKIKDIHLYSERTNDWAILSGWTLGMGGLNSIDMLTNEYEGTIGYSKLTSLAGDPYEQRKAQYMLARTTLSNMMRFRFNEYMKSYDNTLPDNPYCTGFREYTGAHAISMRAGARENGGWEILNSTAINWHFEQHVPESLNVFLQFDGDAFGKFIFHDIPRELPWERIYSDLKWDWGDFNGFLGTIAARLYLGEKEEDIISYIHKWDENNNHMRICFQDKDRYKIYSCNILATLSGKSSLLYLMDWEPATLVDGRYDENTRVGYVSFTAKHPFDTRIWAREIPKTINVGGKTLDKTLWSYDEKTKVLTIKLAQGKQDVQIVFPLVQN